MTAGNAEQHIAPDSARIDVAFGPSAKVSPELRAALDKLAQALEQNEDVQGYMVCSSVSWEPCSWLFKCGAVSG